MSLVARTIQMPNNDAVLLEHYQDFGFHSPDDMVHKAFELLENYLHQQKLSLVASADLYASLYKEDEETQEWTSDAINDWK
jgi:hypothetical protein